MNRSNNIKTYRVKIKSTGEIITVYKLLLGGYCDAKNHTTSYAESNLEFLDNNNTEVIIGEKIKNGM